MSGGLAAETGDRRSAGPVIAAGVVLQLQAAVLSQEGLAQGAAALATELATALRCDRVSVGWLEHGCARVIAGSHSVDFDSRQAQFEKIGAAVIEPGCSPCVSELSSCRRLMASRFSRPP